MRLFPPVTQCCNVSDIYLLPFRTKDWVIIIVRTIYVGLGPPPWELEKGVAIYSGNVVFGFPFSSPFAGLEPVFRLG